VKNACLPHFDVAGDPHMMDRLLRGPRKDSSIRAIAIEFLWRHSGEFGRGIRPQEVLYRTVLVDLGRAMTQ